MGEITTERWSDDLDEVFRLSTGSTHKIVIRDRLGKLFSRLFDETGSLLLCGVSYEICGQQHGQISGRTDINGMLLHRNLPIGDYDAVIDGQYKTVIPTVALDAAQPHDQVVEAYRIDELIAPHEEEESDVLMNPRPAP